MASDPFEEAVREFRRAMEGHARRMREEIERARPEFHQFAAALRVELEAAREEFQRALGRRIESLDATRDYRDRFVDWPRHKRRRRPPRDFEGGEPVPVKPRPNPTQLIDGAEAPVD